MNDDSTDNNQTSLLFSLRDRLKTLERKLEERSENNELCNDDGDMPWLFHLRRRMENLNINQVELNTTPPTAPLKRSKSENELKSQSDQKEDLQTRIDILDALTKQYNGNLALNEENELNKTNIIHLKSQIALRDKVISTHQKEKDDLMKEKDDLEKEKKKVENILDRYHNELNINTDGDVQPQLQRIVRVIEDNGNYDIYDSMVDDIIEQGNETGSDNIDVVREITVVPTTNNDGTVVQEGDVARTVHSNDQMDDNDTSFSVPKLIHLLKEEMEIITNVPVSNSPFIFKEGLTSRELNRKLDMSIPNETEEGKWGSNDFVSSRANWNRNRPHVLNNDVTLEVLGPVILAICIVCNKQRKYFELAYDYKFPDFETDLVEIMKCLNTIKKAKNKSSIIITQSLNLKKISSIKYLLARKENKNKSCYDGYTDNPVISTLLKLEAVRKRKDLIEKTMGGIFSIGDCFADSTEEVRTATIATYAVPSTDYIHHFNNPGTLHDPHSKTLWMPRRIVLNSEEFGIVEKGTYERYNKTNVQLDDCQIMLPYKTPESYPYIYETLLRRMDEDGSGEYYDQIFTSLTNLKLEGILFAGAHVAKNPCFKTFPIKYFTNHPERLIHSVKEDDSNACFIIQSLNQSLVGKTDGKLKELNLISVLAIASASGMTAPAPASFKHRVSSMGGTNACVAIGVDGLQKRGLKGGLAILAAIGVDGLQKRGLKGGLSALANKLGIHRDDYQRQKPDNPVYQISLITGQVIKYFGGGPMEASQTLDIYRTAIYDCCNDCRYSTCGYQFRHEDGYHSTRKSKRKISLVIVYGPDGNHIEPALKMVEAHRHYKTNEGTAILSTFDKYLKDNDADGYEFGGYTYKLRKLGVEVGILGKNLSDLVE
jgi:hypothetical protein